MSEAQSFCFWAAKSYPDTIAILVKQIIIFVAFYLTIINIKIHLSAHSQAKKILNQRTKNLLVIFSTIMLWGLFQTAQNIYSVYIYFEYVFPLGDGEDIDMTQYSIIYVFFDFFPGFFIQTLFIIVPYVFIRNILSQIPVQVFKQKYQLKLKPFVEIWIVIRFVIQILLVVSLLIVDRKDLELINMMDIYFLVTDQSLIFIIILLCKKWFIDKVTALNMKIYYLVIIIGALKIWSYKMNKLPVYPNFQNIFTIQWGMRSLEGQQHILFQYLLFCFSISIMILRNNLQWKKTVSFKRQKMNNDIQQCI